MPASRLLTGLLLTAALVGALGWWFWPHESAVLDVPSTGQPRPYALSAASAPTPAPVSVAAAAGAPPAIQHPLAAIETPASSSARELPRLDDSDARLKDELNAWLGRKKVQQFLQLDAFVRRVVATVDSLAREHAAPALWPVLTTPGRFATLKSGERELISPDNAQRYSALVQFIEVVDARQGVQLYASLYPLFQQAYEELGYPRAYFNDRLVQVIDTLLATPVIEEPLEVTLIEVKGPIPSERPWTRYEFADERLQSLAAGQKMLLRMGAVQHRRLRAKLLEIRGLLTRAPLPSAASGR
jgi:hypothetical protein